jgi:flagellar basal-body rod modification protein FlgD
MTSPLGPLPVTPTPISAVLGAQQPAAPAAHNQLDKDAFLKLLVAQLRYQDPDKPADATAFMAQTAQFTQVERLDDLSASIQQLLSAQLMVRAGDMVGKTVDFTGPNGKPTSGVVESASFSGSTPTLRVGHTDVPLSSVTEVRNSAG